MVREYFLQFRDIKVCRRYAVKLFNLIFSIFIFFMLSLTAFYLLVPLHDYFSTPLMPVYALAVIIMAGAARYKYNSEDVKKEFRLKTMFIPFIAGALNILIYSLFINYFHLNSYTLLGYYLLFNILPFFLYDRKMLTSSGNILATANMILFSFSIYYDVYLVSLILFSQTVHNTSKMIKNDRTLIKTANTGILISGILLTTLLNYTYAKVLYKTMGNPYYKKSHNIKHLHNLDIREETETNEKEYYNLSRFAAHGVTGIEKDGIIFMKVINRYNCVELPVPGSNFTIKNHGASYFNITNGFHSFKRKLDISFNIINDKTELWFHPYDNSKDTLLKTTESPNSLMDLIQWLYDRIKWRFR